MQHKLLLGSTALVSAGLFMSGAQAQEARVGGIEVVLGGYTEFGVAAGNKNTITNGGHDRSYTFYMDNELIVRANGATIIEEFLDAIGHRALPPSSTGPQGGPRLKFRRRLPSGVSG